MSSTNWFCIAIMALTLSLAVCTAHRNFPGTKSDNAKIFDSPPMTEFPPDFYRKCGGGVIGGGCDDCGETPGGGDCGHNGGHGGGYGGGGGGGGGYGGGGGSDDCGHNGGHGGGYGGGGGGGYGGGGGGGYGGGGGGGYGGFGGGYGSGGGGDIPPHFTIPFPWFYIPGFPPLNEPYQCCPSSCGNSNDHCPRFTVHLTHEKSNPGTESKFFIPGFSPLNDIYECCPRSCACENPYHCPGFAMYLNHNPQNVGVPMHNEGDHDATRPDMSSIEAIAPVSN